jgi:uncharacterized protein
VQSQSDADGGALRASSFAIPFAGGDGHTYLYAGATGSILRVAAGNAQRLKRVFAGPIVDSDVPEDLREPLVRAGALLHDGVDEVEILRARNRSVRFAGRILWLTVTVTRSCNFACSICYEREKHGHLERPTADRLVEFVGRSLATKRELSVLWFGGEPLLRLPLIRRLTHRFSEACVHHEVAYSARISTNGLLLRRTVSRELRSLAVRAVQIAFDGPPDLFARRRGLDDPGVFDRVLQNALDASEYLDLIVRVNVDRETTPRIPELLSILRRRGLHGRCVMDLVPVLPTPRFGASSCYSVVSDPELQRVLDALREEAVEEGFALRPPPLLRVRHCGFDDASSFLVDVDGTVHKCVASPETRVGFLDEHDPRGMRLDGTAWARWVSSDPFSDPRCRGCRVLPLCAGGCTYRRLVHGPDACCPPWRDHPEERLRAALRAAQKVNGAVPASEVRTSALRLDRPPSGWGSGSAG